MPDGIADVSSIFYSTTGTSGWSDLQYYAGAIGVREGELNVGEFQTFGSAYPHIVAGKFQVSEVQVRMLYTDATTEPYALLRDMFTARTKVWFRWSYGSGSAHYFKAGGLITQCPLPDAEAGSGEPLAVEVVVKTSQIEEASS